MHKLISHFHKIKFNKNTILVGVAVLGIAVTGFLLLNNYTGIGSGVLSVLGSSDAVAQKSVEYLNANILQEGQTATLVSSSKKGSLVEMKVKIGSTTYDMYATSNGEFLFPQAFVLGPSKDKPAATAKPNNPPPAKQTAADVKKVDKTMLELYVVSKCPFGLQAQRAAAEAIAKIPSLADSVTVRYIGSVVNGKITAMHGGDNTTGEAGENLRQICIRDEQKSKYWNYIACHIKAGDVDSCLKTAGVDEGKLTSCISDPKRGLAYAQEDFDLNEKHGITGSPTYVLNGAEIAEGEFGGRSAEGTKEIVCASSTTEQSFCSTELNATEAATSFSATYSKGTSAAPSPTTTAVAPNCDPAS